MLLEDNELLEELDDEKLLCELPELLEEGGGGSMLDDDDDGGGGQMLDDEDEGGGGTALDDDDDPGGGGTVELDESGISALYLFMEAGCLTRIPPPRSSAYLFHSRKLS